MFGGELAFMKLWRILVVVLISMLIFSVGVIYFSKYEIIEGVWGYKFIGDCDLYYFS